MSASPSAEGGARPLRLAVLASGRGSNLRALIQARESGAIASRVVGVFSDRPEAAALALARAHGIRAWAEKPAPGQSREAFDAAMFAALESVQPDLIVCAGYMRLISASAVESVQGRMINIHPSLLPSYPGLRTHARALAAGDAEHGASVHLVIPALDAGPVIAQARVPVHAGESSEMLAARVLEREHPLLVQCIRAFETGTIRVLDGQIRWRGAPLRSPLALDALGQLGESP